MRVRFAILQLIVLALVAYLDVHYGLGERFYWRFWWWDILLHMLGGVWVGLASGWLFFLFGMQPSIRSCALAALTIGIGWEVFEYVTHTGGSVFMSYPVDTAKDLLDDVLGGIGAGLLFKGTRT